MNFRKLFTILSIPALMMSGVLTSCTLEEENLSGFTLDALAASSVDGYKKLLNNCYFGMERQLYGFNQWMMFSEAGTDLWTNNKNSPTSNVNFFKYGGTANIPTNTLNTVWNVCYDGIGYCNLAIKYADMAPFKTVEEKNAVVAQAYFLRAMYYYNLVEQFGGVTAPTKPSADVNTRPERVSPLEIYKTIIIPDLEFAAQWLPITNVTTIPSKKSAMGFLARAYLQTVEYDDSKAYAAKALEVSKALIDDCESGGGKYNTFMYPTFDEVFQESNNQNNREALWTHRFVVGGVSNNGWVMNMNNELFYGTVTDFPAMKFTLEDYTTWGRRSSGSFMPTHYLLNLYVQNNGTLDPRYHKSFQTTWTVNRPSFTWSDANLKTFDRTSKVTITDNLVAGNTAIDFLHPNDAGYATKIATKADQKYMLIDYNDVYDSKTNSVKMTYTRVNREVGTVVTNPYLGFFPSLVKHNSSNYYVNNVTSNRYGNLNATFMMRMAEVYLIAAEASVYAGGVGNALTYLNKVRTRAGATPLAGTVTVQTILDERARELCGEYVRYYDLKRTKKLNRTYLNETNPDVGQFFRDGVNEVKPIPSTFLNSLQEGGLYYQNNGY
ncbi:RagB/SusD family nutrient uptake outer membrane protein [Flectobacillus rivi]|uniref:RagB/SusD family nutrient uptake outer membrane protein n=1 Tax=Flectobacillus rivi TaxID=2984209 RepID=A0ABT6YWB2_9BACT|nr:RagB/SusD family nutrient uptake outer membrane protein [Flectobacillus rivi]MDI9873168.1 RagB/SusD family nutrient uptake outer membrane protein [Flectobacillus rivi]